MESRLDIALGYATRGMAVLPIYGIKDGKCMCGKPDCGSPGKHPMTRNGVQGASTDPTVIEQWYKAAPNANIGIATGKVSNIWVIDVDGEVGWRTYEKIVNAHGEPGETWACQTGGGGGHFYYRMPNGVQKVSNRVGIATKIDIRGDGGYVVAPPSDHISGNRYEWVIDPDLNDIGDISPVWLDILKQMGVFGEERQTTFRQSEDVPEIFGEGQRNDGLFKIASSLRAKGLTETEILAALKAANQARCRPPLPESEVATIAHSCGRYERGPSESTENDSLCSNSGDVFGRDRQRVPKKPPKLAVFKPSDVDIETLPETRWIWQGRMAAGLALLAGAPKVGKSWLALDLALHVCKGEEYLGRPTAKGSVLYLALEDTPNRIMHRIDDLTDGEKAPESLIVCNDAPPINQGLPEAIADILDGMEDPRMVIIDTLGRVRGMSGRNENAYQYDTREMAALKKLADDREIAVLLIHHKRKASGAGDDIFDKINGTQGIFGAMDTTMLLDGNRQGASMSDAVLAMTGRDIEPVSLAVLFKGGKWSVDYSRPGEHVSAEEIEFYGCPAVKAIRAWCEREKSVSWQGSAADLKLKLIENGLSDGLSDNQMARLLSKYRYQLLDNLGINAQRLRRHNRNLWQVEYKTDSQTDFIPISDDDIPPEWMNKSPAD